jgi:ribonuclease J
VTEFEKTLAPSEDELLFLPLGGAGEIGMNLNLYGHAGKWLMIDLGVTFGDDETPGIDIIMPDPSFIEERREDLSAIVVTHAHEDHLGAIAHLWPRLRCPIYATAFAASILRRKLAEVGLLETAGITVIPLSGKFSAGPFDVEFMTLTHSIPEPNACVVRTPLGVVMHTGDWKLDPDPLVGPTVDESALSQLGDDGVLAMVCDSTNVFVPGHTGSEADVRRNLIKAVSSLKQGVAMACFASNIARLETAAAVGAACGRSVSLVGLSLWRFYDAARENGYLTEVARFMPPEEAKQLPRDKVMYVCTGSQGEPRAALHRVARGDHKDVSLNKGDAVVFSSRVIPGNEKSIGRLQNKLAELGVEVINASAFGGVHVSGHPAREELAQMYQWIRPRIAVPVHGERRHLEEHVKLAQECQVPEVQLAVNGDVVRLAPGPSEIVGQVFSGRLVLDGKRLKPIGSRTLRNRRKMLQNGSAMATLVLDRDGYLRDDPLVTVQGVYDDDDDDDSEIEDSVVDAIIDAVDALPRRADDASIKTSARNALRRRLRDICGKRPETEIHIVRL